MKKLKLRLANIAGAEVLTKEQLKKVMGGETEGSGGINDGKCGSRENDIVRCCPSSGSSYTGICKDLLGKCPSIIGEYETCPPNSSGS